MGKFKCTNLKSLFVPPAPAKVSDQVLDLNFAHSVPIINPSVELRRDADAWMAQGEDDGREAAARGSLRLSAVEVFCW